MTAYRALLLIILASLHRHTLSQSSVFSVTPGNVIAKLGFPARLDCQLARPQEGTFIRWALGDGITMIDYNQCNCVLLSLNSSLSSLYFNVTTQSIGGNYTCLAIGSSGGSVVGSITIAVNPSITPRGSSMTYTQNDTFSLNISVGGIPQPEVTWSKDNAEINSEVTRATASSSGLQVKNAQYETAGRYIVWAANLADTVSETYDIFIRFLPRVTMIRSPDIVEVPVSTIVTITCSVFSYPASTIHWQQQTAAGDYITLETQYVMNSSSNMFRVDTKSTFTFNSSNISGASSYCCSVANVIGTTMECLHFTEDGAPPPPSGFRVTERTPSSITVQWDRSSLVEVIYELRYHVDHPNEQWIVIKLQNDVTTYTLNNLEPNTSYALRITSLRMSIPSFPIPITTRTRISVPGDIRSFDVDSTLMPGTFVLTWEAPPDSVVDYYVIHIRWPTNNYHTINSTNTTVNITDLSENVVYMFAVQAVNDGGSGNITNYRSGVFCFTIPVIMAQYTPHGTTVNISWDLSDSVYSSRNVMFAVAEPSRKAFTSELIDASYRHHCITNLRPSTRYEITLIVILGCTNVSSQLDVLTQSSTETTSFPSQNCVVFDPPPSTTERLSEESESATPDAWVIVLIVMIPLLGVAIMLGIGIYCACKKRYTAKDLTEIPPVSSPSSQAPLHHGTRHHSASSYTGSFASGAATPIRSPPSYHSRSTAYRPALYNGRIDEQSPVGHQQY